VADDIEASGPARAALSPRDLERFERCVLPHLDAAWNLARHMLRDAHEAEDAVQEAMLRACRHFAGLRGVDGRPWLMAIVRNTCLTQLRRRRPAGQAVEFDEEAHTPETAAGPELELARVRASDSVRGALAALPVEFREVIVLRELEGLSYREIATVIDAPIGTVMSRLSRARHQLACALRGDTAGREAAQHGGDAS
jgi:RNA polymerase sigma-70 factor, ECF subfamily